MCLVNRRGLGKAKHLNRATLADTRGAQVRGARHQESGHVREPRRLDDKTTAETKKIEQLTNIMSYRFVEQYNGQSEFLRAKSACPQQTAE